MLMAMTDRAGQLERGQSRPAAPSSPAQPSSPPSRPAPRHRRRGEELEAALLDAAWDELVDAGFARLTMESVAARARTGVAVLYRRWPRKDDLVIAAISHYGVTHPVVIPDTGSLRGDLIEVLGRISAGRVAFTAMAMASFSGLMADTGLTPAELREKLVGDRRPWSEEIYARAHARGEIDLATIAPAVLTMPMDLLRHEMLMTLKPIPRERILSIVDDLFLPLVAGHRQP
jgi:AcrR family transcriptional regulator